VDVCAHLDGTGASWADYMRPNIKALVDCDAILMLPGWESSDVAKLEYHIADKLGLVSWFYDETNPRVKVVDSAAPVKSRELRDEAGQKG
jgi:hypothetical protein